MPRFEVNIPFAGYLTGEVEAENAEDAIGKAIEAVQFRVVVDEGCDFEVAEVETLREVVSGNVSHAPLCDASADKIDA